MLTINRGVLVAIVAVAAFAVWKVALPAGESGQEAVADTATALLDTRTDARFTVAELNLTQQRARTGSFAGAAMPPGATLVRADASSYCVQVGPPGPPVHLAGPGGAVAPGAC